MTIIEDIVSINQAIELLEREKEKLVNQVKDIARPEFNPQHKEIKSDAERKIVVHGDLYDGQVIWPRKVTGNPVTHRIFNRLMKIDAHACVTRKYKIHVADYPKKGSPGRELLEVAGIFLGWDEPRLLITPKKIAKLKGLA